MKFRNKIFIYLSATLFIYVLASSGLKYFGYPVVDYEYNTFYNLTHKHAINKETYDIDLPFFSWRIINNNLHYIDVQGLKVSDGFLQASFRHRRLSGPLVDLEKICEDSSARTIKEIIGNNVIYNIYCENNKYEEIKPYRIYWVPNKVLLFMYNYRKENKREYDNLISKINLTN